MKSETVRMLAPLALVALLGGCDMLKGGKSPKGQVVATVDGREITQAELQAELGGAAMPNDPKAAKAVQGAVLQRLIAQQVLADEAHNQKLDQSPAFAVQVNRAKRQLAVQLLEKKMASEVPPPGREDADRFVNEHPTMFAQRQLFVVEQVQAPRATDENLVRALEPLNDLDQAESLLDTRSMPHERTMTVIDTLRLDPKLAEQISKLPAGEMFIVNTPQALTMNMVKDSKAMPFTGDAATQYALRLLANQRAQEAVSKQGKQLLETAQSKIKYNDNFKPPAGKPAPAAAPPPASSDQGDSTP